MNTVTSKDGTQIAYDTLGAGPAVILVFGALCGRSVAQPELLEALALHFTVYNYDRRGRGDSGDTQPYSVAREIEDIAALVEVAGGSASLYGHSSGGALVLEAAAALGDKVKKIAVYEVPFNDDPAAQQAWNEYVTQLTTLLAIDRRGDAVASFMKLVGTPDEHIAGMRHAPMWPGLEAIAPTLAYDHTALLGEYAQMPAQLAANVHAPALVMSGGASYPFMRDMSQKLSKAMPHARSLIVDDQTHNVNPEVLAPVLIEFFSK